MSRQATKTLHIKEPTFDLLNNMFKIKCTNDEMVASMLWFIKNLDYDEKDFAMLIIEYRKSQLEKEMILAQ